MTLRHALAKLARLMSPEQADIIDPIRLVKAQALLEGELDLGAMERLSVALHEASGSVNYSLDFKTDLQGCHCIEGVIKATLAMTCQRCMGLVRVPLSCRCLLAIIQTIEQAEELPAYYEPLVVAEEKISLIQLIEDELLLALPIAPVHSVEECPVKVKVKANTDLIEKKNPFAELSKLQVKNRSNQ